MSGNLAVAKPEWLVNNRAALDFGPAWRSQTPLNMPANRTGSRVHLEPNRGTSADDAAPIEREAHSYERMFVDNLDIIDGVVRFVCQRQRLSGANAEEFDSEVKLRLVDHDYAVFRKFQHRSSLRTYLTIVIQRIYLDYRTHLWGKWRPSAEAQRLGPVAVQLETLMARDGYGFDQACEYLRINEQVAALDSELYAIAARLPTRTRPTMTGEEALEAVADGTSRTDEGLLLKDQRADARRIRDALTTAMRSISDQDRLILRLRFQDGLAVAQIARALHLNQKPLYRRFDTLLRQLRGAIERTGVDPAEARELVNRIDIDISLALLATRSGIDHPDTGPAGAEGRSS